MNFLVIGTDHRMQGAECGFEGLLRALVGQQFFEPLKAIGEEYHEKIGGSIGQQLAKERGVRWFDIEGVR